MRRIQMFLITLFTFVALTQSAQAEWVRCRTSSNGWCHVQRTVVRAGVVAGGYVTGDVAGGTVPYRAGARDGRCVHIPGAVYSPEAEACVQSIRNQAELNRISPPVANDPMCEGKPAGYTYDVSITGPQGQPGVKHQTCGVPSH